MSSASASPASSPLPKTPSPAPESPPKSPSKSRASPKKSNGDKEEAKRVKEALKAEEKAEKWRKAQIAKIQKVIEKQENKAKDLCEKLSAAWDPYGVSANQIRLLEAKAISTPDELEQQREVYESGPKMMEDFLHWIQVQFGVPEPEGGNVGSDDMQVDSAAVVAPEPVKTPEPVQENAAEEKADAEADDEAEDDDDDE